MIVIEATNVDEALRVMLSGLQESYGHVDRDSRAGKTREYICPVTTVYKNPMRRVLFAPSRDANPFFHLIEALWMLEGRDDIEPLKHYNRRVTDFSDDGVTWHGAYGYRWREHFNKDQIEECVCLLLNNPSSRRAIIAMWDPFTDLHDDESLLKDVPCNTTISLQVRNDALDMTIFCRSNDAIWGATGSNAVHFSILQEYLAARLNMQMGYMYQISNNLHVYYDVFKKLIDAGFGNEPESAYYQAGVIAPDQIVHDADMFDINLNEFFQRHDAFISKTEMDGAYWRGLDKFHNPFFGNIVVPMVKAFHVFRNVEPEDGRYKLMLDVLRKANMTSPSSDWLLASIKWTKRRKLSYEASLLK